MSQDRESLIVQVAGHLHGGQRVEAARLVAQFSNSPRSVESEEVALEYCYSLLQWCLDNNRYEWASKMLWNPRQFYTDARCTQDVWRTMRDNQAFLLQGSASMSKSYGGGGWLLLDWIRDPQYTTVKLIGPSESHLKDNLFTHLVMLHRDSTLPLPGIVGDLFIGLDPRARKSAISGVVIPLGKKAAGRLQGSKRFPRKRAHPALGLLSRMRIFIDEFEETPGGIWKDIDNIFSNMDGDIDGFKIGGSYNPRDIGSEVAKRAEPPQGWEELDADKDKEWTSKRGWRVLRLDAKHCENILEKRTIYPGLQTIEGYNRIIENAGGMDTPGYWTMCRGMYPRSGSVFSVIPQIFIPRMRGEFMFGEEPENFGGGDLALEGGDAAEFAHGRFGRAVGYRLVAAFGQNSQEKFFTDKDGRRVLRHALQVDGIEPLTPGDTVHVAGQVRKVATGLHVKPLNIMLDRTGNGAGVHDLLLTLWDPDILGINYSEGATDRKILAEDSKTAKEEYVRADSELWFALKKWGEHGFIRFVPAALSEEVIKELTGRRYNPGRVTTVEPKPDYKARGHKSPNKADSVTLLLHAVRVRTRVIPAAVNEVAGYSIGSADTANRPVPMIVCVTNRYEDLDGGDDRPAGFDV